MKPFVVRVRSRDGLERVSLSPGATVGDLKTAIRTNLSIPLEKQHISQDPRLLTTKDEAGFNPESFKDMIDEEAPLESLGIQHGDMIYLLYDFERQVEGPKLSEFEKRSFGAHMTIESMVAKQTRIERQENALCTSASFEMHAANMFQSYIQSALAFSIKRGGILYGEIDEDSNVLVHAILEPPQEGNADRLMLERGSPSEDAADRVASAFGWQKVGWVFSQSTNERDYIFSAEEVCQMAAIQSEMGKYSVTGVVALFPPDEEGAPPEVHFEAFQVSEQCIKLYEEGWFKSIPVDEEPSSMLKVVNPKDPEDKTPIIVSREDVDEVDAELFLVPVSIKDHEGPVMTNFPIENRLLPQGSAELKAHLDKFSAMQYSKRLKDFHLLVFLAEKAGLAGGDIDILAAAIKNDEPIPEGYQLIINGFAGM